MVGKAEYLDKGANPRFVVTSLERRGDGRRAACTRSTTAPAARWRTASRSSNSICSPIGPAPRRMRANQLRLWFSSIAYTTLVALRQHGLAGTELESARCDTIRLQLLKIGAQVQVTVRKIWLSLSEAYPYRRIFMQVLANICRLVPMPLGC